MPVSMSSTLSYSLPVTTFGLVLETSWVGCLASPEIPCFPTLTKFGAYEFPQAFNRYLETLDSSQVRNLKELVDWNRQHADKELPKGTGILTKFTIDFYPDT